MRFVDDANITSGIEIKCPYCHSDHIRNSYTISLLMLGDDVGGGYEMLTDEKHLRLTCPECQAEYSIDSKKILAKEERVENSINILNDTLDLLSTFEALPDKSIKELSKAVRAIKEVKKKGGRPPGSKNKLKEIEEEGAQEDAQQQQ